jgi:hypothetical protein
MSAGGASVSSSGAAQSDNSGDPLPRRFEFPSHQSHMLNLAKMCQESKQFADCVIQSDDGFSLRAHRLVLGAASSFLKMVFQQVRTLKQDKYLCKYLDQTLTIALKVKADNKVERRTILEKGGQ